MNVKANVSSVNDPMNALSADVDGSASPCGPSETAQCCFCAIGALISSAFRPLERGIRRRLQAPKGGAQAQHSLADRPLPLAHATSTPRPRGRAGLAASIRTRHRSARQLAHDLHLAAPQTQQSMQPGAPCSNYTLAPWCDM
jgi:hypothetical protein